MTEPKRFWRPHVVIAEESEMMARTISQIVQLHCDVVRLVRDGQSAFNAVLELHPDVFVLDVLMPVLDGIQVVRRLRALNSNCRMVILTGLESQEYIAAALMAGANGFVFKRKMAGDLPPAIAEVLAGRRFISEGPTPKSGETQ
jgi:DNA-binding NarL/FixJ family response regulator